MNYINQWNYNIEKGINWKFTHRLKKVLFYVKHLHFEFVQSSILFCIIWIIEITDLSKECYARDLIISHGILWRIWIRPFLWLKRNTREKIRKWFCDTFTNLALSHLISFLLLHFLLCITVSSCGKTMIFVIKRNLD